MSGAGPTARTLEWARKQGWKPDVVERWLPRAKVRKDLFGFIDIVALDGQYGVHGIQATSSDNITHRQEKLLELPLVLAWLDAGNRLSIVGWAKRGPRGARKLWTPRQVAVRLNRHSFGGVPTIEFVNLSEEKP